MVALMLGPVLFKLAQRERRAMAALDSFVLVAVIGMVLFEIVPTALEMSGLPALLALACGLLAPSVAEGPFHMASRKAHRTAMGLAVVGMAFHAFADGIALGAAHSFATGHGVEVAVIAHQLPVAMAVWWLLRPVGLRIAAIALGSIAVATVTGFLAAEPSMNLFAPELQGWFQAFIGGLLLHVISHGQPGHRRGGPPLKVATAVGALAGFGLLAALIPGAAHGHDHGADPGGQVLAALVELTRESAPALLLAFVLAGFVSVLLPAASVRWLRRGSTAGRSLRGVAFGLPLPLCSCGVVPVYRSLVKRGVPAAAGLAFLVATPELGLDAVLLSLPLLGTEMTLARVLAAAIVALVVGWWVGGYADRTFGIREEQVEDTSKTESQTRIQKLATGLRVGLVDVVDDTAPWILFGLVIAALLAPWLDPATLTAIPPILQVALFALLGMPTYVCASGATPLVAVLIAKGMSPGAALAFLLTGPATNATTFGLLDQLHGRKVAIAFATTMVCVAIGLGYIVDFGVAEWIPGLSVGSAPGHQHADHGLWSDALLVGLGGLFLISVLRQGPRDFIGHLGLNDHEHGDGCCSHDDGHAHTSDGGHAHADGGHAHTNETSCHGAAAHGHEGHDHVQDAGHCHTNGTDDHRKHPETGQPGAAAEDLHEHGARREGGGCCGNHGV